MDGLELVEVIKITAGHSLATHDELGAEGHVEADEDERAADASPFFGIHAAGHLGPPVVQAAEEGDHGAAHHYVMEVRDYEIGVGEVDVDGERREEDAGEAADGE